MQDLLNQFEELERDLGDPHIHSNQKKYRELSQKHSYLSELKQAYETFQIVQKNLASNQQLLKGEKNSEFIDFIREDIKKLEGERAILQSKIELLLVPPDPNDQANVIMEIRAGTGGDEAAIFVGDCIRMYRFFADKKGWKHEALALTDSEAGGYKEYIPFLCRKGCPSISSI